MESCVATAYTIRYGSANVGLGPPADVVGLVSVLNVLDMGSAEGGGGGSMTEGAGDGLEESGSGNDGMASSGEEVSIVMCLVTGGAVRSV